MVNHAYNVASYILEHDNPIQDGETIDGVAMSISSVPSMLKKRTLTQKRMKRSEPSI